MDRSNASKPLHGWHYHHLLSRAAQVKLPHPIMLRAIGGSTNTNNRLQARKISHFLRCDFPPQARILPYRSRYPQQTAPASSDIRDRRLVPIAMDQAGATLRLTIEIGNAIEEFFRESGSSGRLCDRMYIRACLIVEGSASQPLFYSLSGDPSRSAKPSGAKAAHSSRGSSLPSFGSQSAKTRHSSLSIWRRMSPGSRLFPMQYVHRTRPMPPPHYYGLSCGQH